MRISDWSSDVSSSDLTDAEYRAECDSHVNRILTPGPHRRSTGEPHTFCCSYCVYREKRSISRGTGVASNRVGSLARSSICPTRCDGSWHRSAALNFCKLGSVPCRERVCQSV